MLAIFGLVLFQQPRLAFLCRTPGGAVFGRSFLAAGAMMSLIALPLVFGATREGLQAIPRHVREASYAAGQDEGATIRRVLLPAARPTSPPARRSGMGRDRGRHRDRRDPARRHAAASSARARSRSLGTLRGTGCTLTSYVYNNSPAGEGNAPEKAYAAAFVLLLIVMVLNFAVDVVTAARERRARWNA